MRPWVVVAALNAAFAVALGAYAAHGLAGDAYAQSLGERAALYQMIHALAILAADRLAAEGRRAAHAAALLFAGAILAFSGSLTVKALGGPLPVPMITPIGGVMFILGWLTLAVCGLSRPRS